MSSFNDLHGHKRFYYLSFSCPSVLAVLQPHLELESSLMGGRYQAGCKASVCREPESASQSGTAALLYKRKTCYYNDILWHYPASNCARKVISARPYFAVDTKSLSSPPPSSKASSVLASPVDWRPITTHCRANRLSVCLLKTQSTINYKSGESVSGKPSISADCGKKQQKPKNTLNMNLSHKVRFWEETMYKIRYSAGKFEGKLCNKD